MAFIKITEAPSAYRHLEKMATEELLVHINHEDKSVAFAVEKAIPGITGLVNAIADKMLSGGRLFYIGAGTSGRLGILDASECPPTFGIGKGLVTGVIAGGQKAIAEAVEFAEDDREQGWKDLQQYHVAIPDIVVGIAASGTTPYVIGALEKCRENRITTGSICCNPDAPLSSCSDHPVEVVTGPEIISGSTRMKSGTAQKMVLNMISTAVMVQLGRVEDNRMVNLQLTNEKLLERGVKMLMERTGSNDYEYAKNLLQYYGSVKKAIESYHL